MGWKIFFSFMFILFAVFLLVFYWFIPFSTTEFKTEPGNFNFSLSNSSENELQFYEKMRYPNPNISYLVDDCSLSKENELENAFEILSNLTLLGFYPVSSNEDLSITCDEKNKIEGGMFIAGEGGPTNITKTEKFNVILNGKILLIRNSQCSKPNIALHEILHTLGFTHSSNPNNIMYNFTKCGQEIGPEIISLIDELYSIASYPDLSIQNASAIMHGKYLNANFSVVNNGLQDSEEFELLIYSGEKVVKELPFESLEIGYGRAITLENVWINKISIEDLEFFIDYPREELDKTDNRLVLKIKK